jgi:pimeloyl-ACP methyl ester carboxylesterase
MKDVFFLSGLGADKRVFDYLNLEGHRLHHIFWIEPLRGETIGEYARRLLPQIQGDNPILVGVSFGGIIALEIANLVKAEMVILISSAKSPADIPNHFKMMARLNIYKLIRPKPVRTANPIMFWLFGVVRKEHKTLLSAIMADTDETFFAWAVEAIPAWKGNTPSCKVIQVHGTSDRILTFRSADYIVPRGGHLMIVTRADEISQILQGLLR